jgi:aminoglycoside phosphotransferase (APT) family kinase protein
MSRGSTSEPADSLLFEELVDGWSSLGGRRPVPERIDVLKKHRGKPKVCRLVGCTSGASDIVAKCSYLAAVEPILYAHVLDTVPGTPRCRGIAPCRDGARCWIFLEHVDGEPYVADLAAHRALTVRWLGAIHSITSKMPVRQLLPQHDSAYYRSQLRTARDAISAALAGGMIDGDGRSRLAATVDRCDSLDGQWDALEILTEDVRPGIVHNDLASRNIRIRQRAGRVELVAFDWEFAGYGVPVADLAQFAMEGRWRELSAIVDQMGFTDVSPRNRLRRLATAGRVLRLITCLEWQSRSPSYAWRDSTVHGITICGLRLDECVRALATEA